MMKTTDIIQRLLAHPDPENILRELEDRLAIECATPDAAGIFSAYLNGDVLELFQSFTGWSMENFLTIARIIPDRNNLAGLPAEAALFQDINGIFIEEAP